MAAVDDIYDEITRNSRTRKGRSFFPAANAINSTPQGRQIYGSGSGNAGFQALPPDQNPAYQAAISGGRPSRSGYVTIQTPSGGSMSVPRSQERKYTDLLFKGNTVADIGFQRPNTQAAYALGDSGTVPTGNTPFEKSYRMGYEGGPVNPAPSGGLGYQIGQAVTGLPSALGGFSRSIANFFQKPQNYQPSELNPQTPELSYIPKPPGIGNLVPPPALVRPPAPTGINNLVPPNPYVGRAPNERMFPTGAGGVLPFPSANPGLGTVRMANERFPGNLPPSYNSQYPTPISNPIYNPSLQAQGSPRRYSDLGYY